MLRFRKLLALLLCAAMLLALLPALAAAENGTADDSAPVSARGAVTVLDEPISLSGISELEITQPGETVYRPFVPEQDGFYRFIVYPESTLGRLVDSNFAELEYQTMEHPLNCYIVTYFAEAGKTYYFGTYFESPERTGTTRVSLQRYAANSCGYGPTWSFDAETGVLRLGGSGNMWAFTPENVPWRKYRDQIKTLELSDHYSISIGAYAFYGCSELSTVTNVKSIKGVGAYAFYGTALQEMVWPEHCMLGGIGDYAFAYCKNLKTVTVGQDEWTNGVGNYAFYASGLETATFANELYEIRSYAFAECKNLVTVNLPADGTPIGEYAFQNSGLTAFHIPKTVTEIGKGAFSGCTRLASDGLTVDADNPVFSVRDGMLYSKDLRTLIAFIPRQGMSNYTVPIGTFTIGECAFYGAETLAQLELQEGVTAIEADAFCGCTALTDVYYAGTEEERNEKLTAEAAGNDALLGATWHYREPCTFDGTLEWDPEDVAFKGSTAYMVWTGSALTPRFTLKDAEGTELDPATYTYEYRENTAAGTAYLLITFTEGYSGTLRTFFKIYLPATTATTVENRENGIYLSWKPVDGADGYVIYRRAWNLKSAGWTDFVRWNNTTETMWTDTNVYAGTRYQYGVKAYFSQRMDTVTGALLGGNVGDNFNLGMVGPLKTTVRITTRELTSLTAGSKTIKAIWSGSSVFTGYELRYATDANFTKNLKTVRIADPKTTEMKLKSLTNGTAYYVAVRSYHLFEGMTYYGQWSHSICIKPGSTQTVYNVQYRALCIGQNKYSQNPLKGCVNDMNTMAGMLKGLKQPARVTTLSNAKKAAVISAIPKAFADADDNDVSIFYYSGHGVNAGGNETYQGALVGVDLQYLTFAELAAELSKVKGHVVVILDSCHSGASIGKGEEDSLEAFNSAVIEAFAAYDGPAARSGELRSSKFTVITAAYASQSSYDGKFDGSGYDQGAFTAALIKGMGCKYTSGSYSGSMPADTNNDKLITLNELYNYSHDLAYSWTRQSAQYYGSLQTVLFRRK